MNTARRRGTALAVSVYTFWGIAPLYWALLKHVNPVEVILHRCLWAAVFAWLLLIFRREQGQILPSLTPITLLKVSIQSVCLFINWLIFIYAISIDRTIDGALGYMINPLVSALVAILIFKEKPSKKVVLALIIAGLGLTYFLIYAAIFPYIGLSLAATFTCYSTLKKKQSLSPLQSVSLEMSIIGMCSLLIIAVLSLQGKAVFGFQLRESLLLAGAGLVTLLPFILYGAAMILIPFTRIAMLQYIAPSLMFLVGVLFLGETIDIDQVPGYILVWIALMVYTYALREKEKKYAGHS